jgi:putative ABC transport system permease protein
VIKQALILSVLGYLLGLAGGYLLYTMLEYYTHILMFLTINRCMLIMFLTVVMCIVGGFLAVQKVLKADPAELY